MNCPGSRKQDITTKIAMLMSDIGFSMAEISDMRPAIHKQYKTDECLEILKEMRTKSTRKGITNVLSKHNFFK
jgi:hypothetical protein